MSNFSDNEIRQIIQKAALLQKFNELSSSPKLDPVTQKIQELYKVTDDLGIPRKFVHEAYIESTGVPIQEPLLIDNNDFNNTEVVGYATGSIDKDLFNELKAQLEYHFNTLGQVSHRKNKTIWKAKPVGPSKLIASSNSPEAEFEQVEGSTKITIRQSLKTLNKLYLPGMAAAFGGFMLFAAVLFDQLGNDYDIVGNDIVPALIFSVLIMMGSLFYSRFVNSRKRKKKNNLLELVETLQSKMERHLKATTASQQKSSETPEIDIPEMNADEENVEKTSTTKLKE